MRFCSDSNDKQRLSLAGEFYLHKLLFLLCFLLLSLSMQRTIFPEHRRTQIYGWNKHSSEAENGSEAEDAH